MCAKTHKGEIIASYKVKKRRKMFETYIFILKYLYLQKTLKNW